MRRAVVAAGGWAHPGDDLVEAAQALIEPQGFDEINVVRDAVSFVAALEQPCDLLVVGACWFSMTDARYTEEQRREYAVHVTPELAEALRQVRDAGCPLLALHTAVICFDGSPLWRDWLGGAWNWQTSFHPPPEPMHAVPGNHGVLTFEPFAVTDELYQGLDVDSRVTVVAQSEMGHPLAWLNTTPHGRSAVNVLGHDHRSLRNPRHREFNESLLAWLLNGETRRSRQSRTAPRHGR